MEPLHSQLLQLSFHAGVIALGLRKELEVVIAWLVYDQRVFCRVVISHHEFRVSSKLLLYWPTYSLGKFEEPGLCDGAVSCILQCCGRTKPGSPGDIKRFGRNFGNIWSTQTTHIDTDRWIIEMFWTVRELLEMTYEKKITTGVPLRRA
ncbi:uncharacterized protein GJ701_011746 isoform 1-T3 [Geothlypis trichas]